MNSHDIANVSLFIPYLWINIQYLSVAFVFEEKARGILCNHLIVGGRVRRRGLRFPVEETDNKFGQEYTQVCLHKWNYCKTVYFDKTAFTTLILYVINLTYFIERHTHICLTLIFSNMHLHIFYILINYNYHKFITPYFSHHFPTCKNANTIIILRTE